MTIKLVDPIFLKTQKFKKFKIKVDQSNPINKNVILIIVALIFGSLIYFIYTYIKNTPIINPDLECLPKNIRNTTFCKNIEEIAKKNRDKLNKPKPKLNTSWNAYNEDELTIKFSNAP